MPIYEFACPKCRKVYSFLSKRVAPSHTPVCPKCGSKRLSKEISRFAFCMEPPSPQRRPETVARAVILG